MVDLGDQGENLPVDGGALGAPNANPPTPQIPHQESGGPSSSTSLTMTEFTSFMESFKFRKLLLPHQHFVKTPLWMLME